MQHSTPQASGYSEAGASRTRRALRGFVPNSSSPNEDINWNNATLRQRGRMLYQGASIATSAIHTNRTKIVGVGLQAKPTPCAKRLGLSPEQSKAWAECTEEEWRLWADKKQHCDSCGMNNFAALQQIAVVSWLTSGDMFALIQRTPPDRNNPYALRLHLLEADRVCTPAVAGVSLATMTDGRNPENGNRIFDGVEVDGNGKVVAYHVCSDYPQANGYWRGSLTWVRVLATGKYSGMPNVLHLMNGERPEQYRGITYLAQAMEPILQLRRYTESTLLSALVQTYFSAWITTATSPDEIPFNEVGDGMPHDVPMPHGEHEYEMGPGTVNHLQDGEDIKFGNPNIPTASFSEFTRSIAKLCGAALEIPQEVLLKEFNSSYSAARAALQETWEAIRMRRSWLVDDFCQPVYEIWLAEAVARGRICAPGFFDDPALRAAWSQCRWFGPTAGQLDPLKEAKAASQMVKEGFKTRAQVTTELGGGNWDENVAQLMIENKKLAKALQTNGGEHA